MNCATVNTTFALDCLLRHLHTAAMMSAAEILAKLKAKKVTQKAIADALGIQQPNVNTLYNPVKRTGKPRDLAYDEGITLIERFGLDEAQGSSASTPLPNAAVLTSAFGVLLDSLGIDPFEDGRAQKLAARFPDALQSIVALQLQAVDPGSPREATSPARGEETASP